MTRADLEALQKAKPFASMGELIYELLRQEIIHVQLLPNTKLNEIHLVNRLNISRSPIQYAFERLIAEGLLIKEKHKAPTVAPVDVRDCLEICTARISVEGQAAFLAAKRATEEQMTVIEGFAGDYKRYLAGNEDIFKTLDRDFNFHSAIVRASGNRYLMEMYECIQNRILRYRCYLKYLIQENELRKELLSRIGCHDSILYALKNSLSEIARKEISHDIDGMRELLALRNTK